MPSSAARRGESSDVSDDSTESLNDSLSELRAERKGLSEVMNLHKKKATIMLIKVARMDRIMRNVKNHQKKGQSRVGSTLRYQYQYPAR